MNKSSSIDELSEALAKFQAEVKNPPNTAINPYYKSKYAPLGDVLNTVRPVLGKYGLSFVQNQITNENGQLGVTTTLMHSSGQYIETDFIFASPEKNTPQGLGSVSTYLRRYQLSSLLGIASEDDDDGNANEKNANEKSPPKSSTKSEKAPENKEETSQDSELTKAISTIEALVGTLQSKSVDKKLIAEAIKKHNIVGDKAIANYNKVTSIEVARAIYKELKALEA